MLAFLCGGMEYATDGGRAWRERIRLWLQEALNHRVYDPTVEAQRIFSAEELAGLADWKTSDVERFRRVMRVAISRDLVDAVEFSRVNLTDANDTRRFRDIDLVFCRNLLIYFDDLSRRVAAEAFYDAMSPGGFIWYETAGITPSRERTLDEVKDTAAAHRLMEERKVLGKIVIKVS